MNRRSSTTATGSLGIRVLKPTRYTAADKGFWGLLALGLPTWTTFFTDRYVFWWRVRNLPRLLRSAWRIGLAHLFGVPHMHGALFLRFLRHDGRIHELGLASLRVVTNNGVGFIVDAWENLVELEIMKFHGLGTGTNAENATDSALQAESTTALNPDSTRATGTLAEAASNIFSTVGTLTFDASAAITEHGLFSLSGTGTGVLMDRSVFAAVNVVNTDQIQSTYQFTLNAGN